jgi:hypothetical protein
MNNILKMLGTSALLCLLFVAPATAQIGGGLDFKTTFPFWVNNVKLPAGAYTIRQGSDDETMLQIQDASGTHTVMVPFMPTQADSSHATSDVTFKRYGTTEFLNMAWVGGQKFGMQMEPSKAEKKLAAAGTPETHKVSGKAK